MAMTPLGPASAFPGVASPQYPLVGRLPSYGGTGGMTMTPILPLPATLIIGGSFAMSLAPLVLPFLALLSWWFK